MRHPLSCSTACPAGAMSYRRPCLEMSMALCRQAARSSSWATPVALRPLQVRVQLLEVAFLLLLDPCGISATQCVMCHPLETPLANIAPWEETARHR